MTKRSVLQITDDLKINRGLVVKLKFFNVDDPRVVEIMFSLFAIPKEELTLEEYEKSISAIERKCVAEFRKYVRSNGEILQNRMISDFNFTSANLKKNYNKYVSFSIFVRQSGSLPMNKIKTKIRESIKEMSSNVSKCFSENGFACSKKKK